MSISVQITHRFGDALGHMNTLHREQVRKGTGTPYVSHLLSVAALVLEDGGDEDEAIAALFHDAVEDQGGLEVANWILARYGERVHRIVMSCTDTHETPKPEWRARKEAFIASLSGADASVRRVVLADKVHNLRSLLLQLRAVGDATWYSFKGAREGSLWYYRSVLEALRDGEPSTLIVEYERLLADIESFTP